MTKIISALLFLALAIISIADAQITNIPDSLMAAGDFNNAAVAYGKIIADSNRIGKLDKGNAFMRRGNCLVNMEKFKEASADYFSALRVFEEIHNEERICTAFGNIANVYHNLNELNAAETYYGKAIAISVKLKDNKTTADIINDQAVIEYKKGNIDAAIAMHLLAINQYKNDLSEETLCKHYLNLGNCYDEKNVDSSLYYYRKAELIAENIEDSLSLVSLYLNIGDLSKQKGNFREALTYLDKSLLLNPEYGDSIGLSLLYHNLAEVYDSLHNYEQAYLFSKKEQEVNEALYNIEKSKFATELSGKYESDKKDEKIRTQETENKLKQRNLLLSLAGLALAVALGIISFISFRRKRKANLVLKEQNDRIEKLNRELDASNQVKSKLFSVISHDIRGPISSIYAYLQMQQTKKEDERNIQFSKQTEQLLDTLEDLLVWSKSQLHQFVPSFEKLSLRTAVEQVSALLQPAINEKNLRLENRIPTGIVLNTDLNMFTIILRNVLSNCIKYSISNSSILVGSISKGSNIEISFINQSQTSYISSLPGKENSIISSDASGLGITLIREFIQKLNGSVEYLSEGDKVSTIVTLPAS